MSEPWQIGLGKLKFSAAFGGYLVGGAVSGVPFDWDALEPLWVDISDYVIERWHCKSGRDNERADVQASQMEFVLDNHTGIFDRNNPDSPFRDVDGNSLLLPYVPIKVETADLLPWGPARQLFFGTTGDWALPRTVGRSSILRMRASDPWEVLNRDPLHAFIEPGTVWDGMNTVLDLAGFPTSRRVLYGSFEGPVLSGIELDGQSAQEAIILLLRAGGGYRSFCGFQRNGSFAYGGRYIQFTAPFNEVKATFGSTDEAIACGEPRIGSDIASLYTQVEVAWLEDSPVSATLKTTVSVVIGGATLVGLTEALPCIIPEGAQIDFGLGLVAKLAAEAAVGDTTLTIVPLAYDIPGGRTARYDSNVAIVADNAAQVRYGKVRLTISQIPVTSRAEAQAMAEDMLYEYSSPRYRVESIPLTTNGDLEQAEQAIERVIGERIAWEDRPYYASSAPESVYSTELEIIGTDITATPGDPGSLQTLLYTAPVPKDRDFWTLGADEDDNLANSLIGATDADEAGEAILSY